MRGEKIPGLWSRVAAGLGKTFESRLFIGKFRENLVELRDLQNFFHFRRQTHHFHGPALFNYSEIVANEFADAGTIEIIEPLQIQDNVVFALAKEALNRVAKGLAFKRSEAAADVHERHLIRLPDLDGEAQIRVLVRESDDFTLNREEGKGRGVAGKSNFVNRIY